MVTQKDSVFGLGLVLAVCAFRRRSRGTVAMEPRCPTDTTAVPYHRGTISSVNKRSRQEASTTVHAAQVQPRDAVQTATSQQTITIATATPSPPPQSLARLRVAQSAMAIIALFALQMSAFSSLRLQTSLPAVQPVVLNSASWVLAASVLLINACLLEVAARLARVADALQLSANQSQGTTIVVPEAVAATLLKLDQTQRVATPAAQAPRGALALEPSPAVSTPSIWADVATMDKAAFAAACGRAAEQVGLEGVPGSDTSQAQDLSVLPYSPQDLSGMWNKDRQRSDSMEGACDAAQLRGLMRHAIKVLKGLQITLTHEAFQFAVVSVVPILKIIERYALDGTISRCNRRDMRRGKMHGRVQLTARGVVCLVRWDEPLPGWGVELFELVDGDLVTTSQMFMSGRHEVYKTVYVRPG